MSTAQLEINSWVQTENTLEAVEVWSAPDEAPEPQLGRGEPDLEEPERTLPDDFWQEWFGLWR